MKNFTHILAQKSNNASNIEFASHPLEESASNIYLHGEVESMNNFDLVTFPVGNRPKVGGIYPSKVYLRDEDEALDCTLFMWENRQGFKGLVVLNGDIPSIIYANEKYVAKAEDL